MDEGRWSRVWLTASVVEATDVEAGIVSGGWATGM